MPKISKVVMDAVVARLADPLTGFNATLANVAPDYGIEPFTIDFGPQSPNFILGQLSEEFLAELVQSESFSPPFLAVYAAGSQDDRSVVLGGVIFAGVITVGIDVALEIPYETNLRDYESPGNAVEEAMFVAFNSIQALDDFQARGALYDGTLRRNMPSPIKFGNDSIARRERFALTFGNQQA